MHDVRELPLAALFAFALASCVGGRVAVETPRDDSGSDASSALDAGLESNDGGPETETNFACPTGLQGPTLLPVQSRDGRTNYCIGSTEVTNAQYAIFVTAKGNDFSGQPAVCASDMAWQPYPLCNERYDPVNKPDDPVACVSWCNAYGYCKWAGQRLCGRINGGSNAFGDYADPAKSEWFNACSGGGAYAYPYGNQFDAGACDGLDYFAPDGGVDGGPRAIPVRSATACQGSRPALYGMSGNVSEWEDSCKTATGGGDLCWVRGGDWATSSGVEMRCDSHNGNALADRNVKAQVIGIRCCY